VALIAVGCLAALPIGRLVFTALVGENGFDLGPFIERLSRSATQRATVNTLDTAFLGALLSLALGAPMALLVGLTDTKCRQLTGFLLLLPLMIAPQVTALAYMQLVSPSSAFLGAIRMAPPPGTPNPLLGRSGIILLFGVQHAPVVFITLRAGLASLPRDYVEAARASGAAPLRVLLTIILPLLRPWFLAALALAFVSGVGNFGIPAFLGIPANYSTLATLIYQQMASYGSSVLPQMAMLSLIIATIALAGIGAQSLAASRTEQPITTGMPVRFKLGPWSWPVGIFALALIGTLTVLPLLALVTTSLVPAYGVRLSLTTLTLDNYAEVLFRQASTIRAFINSFYLSALAALVLAILAIPVALSLRSLPFRLRQALNGLIDLPYALPGIVLAVACILLFLRPLPLIGSLYNTPWIILVAYLMRFAALALRPVDAALGNIPPQMTEAAAAAGAGSFRRLVTITLPLAAPAATAGALLVFMSAYNELTVSALLWSNRNETLGVILFSLEEAGLSTQASAIAVITVAVVVALLRLLDRLKHKLPANVLPWR
jgi:iron(III) transport system permease protein